MTLNVVRILILAATLGIPLLIGLGPEGISDDPDPVDGKIRIPSVPELIDESDPVG